LTINNLNKFIVRHFDMLSTGTVRAKAHPRSGSRTGFR